MKKYIYDTVDVLIPTGSQFFADSIDLRDGMCDGVRFIDFSLPAAIRDHAINVGVNSSDGSALIGATDYRDFISTGGSYEEGFKPTYFHTRSQINVQLTASENVKGADLVGQLIFKIEVPSCE